VLRRISASASLIHRLHCDAYATRRCDAAIIWRAAKLRGRITRADASNVRLHLRRHRDMTIINKASNSTVASAGRIDDADLLARVAPWTKINV